MTRSYQISRGAAAYYVGFSLLWFGLIVGFVIIGQFDIPHDLSAAHTGAAVIALLIALAVPLTVASLPYEVALRDDQECEFRSLLRRRRVRVHQIRSIASDEDDIYVRHDGGRVHMAVGGGCDFKDLFIRLVELNPAIEVKGWLRHALDEAASTTRATGNG